MDRHPKEKAPGNAAVNSAPARVVVPLRPNFSGKYILDRHASKLEGGAASIRGATLNIDHYEPMIRIDAKFEFFDKTFAWSMQRTADGREKVDPSDTRNLVSLRWDNDMLLFTHRTSGPDEVITTWSYELVDGSSRLNASEQIRGGGRDQNNIWVFDRH
jgi:hypothetical protein